MRKTNTLLLLCAIALSIHNLSAQAPREENSLRIMSYNVRNCTGLDDVMDIDRVADVITRTSPDIVALQELDSVTIRTNGRYMLEEIAKRTLMHYVFAPAINYQGGKYGVGMLSKEKPLGYKATQLPGGNEPRIFLLVEFEKYYMGSTHLALSEADRIASIPIIVDMVADLGKPIFFAGDINATPESSVQVAMTEHFNTLNNPKHNTFPANEPDRCIDYIYADKQSANLYTFLRNGVVPEAIASDHRPLYADVRVKASADKVFRTKPYLQNPTGNGITISWLTTVPTESWVEYRQGDSEFIKKALYVDGQMVCNNTHHKIRLEELSPGETYSYRVCSREISLYGAYKKDFGPTVYSETYSFRMPSQTDRDFTAIILNDIHKNNSIVDSIGSMLNSLHYDLVIFNGDCIDDPRNETDAVSFLSYMCEGVGAESVPIMFTRGNHEIRGAYSIELRSLLDYVGDKTYSAFNWGDTRFVMLDCGEDKPDDHSVYYGMNDFEGLRNAQIGFLKSELKTKSYKKAARRILIHHIPIYGSGDKYNPCQELWGPVLEKAPFDVSINGHTHRFAHHPSGSEKGNPFPVVIGGGSRIDAATMMVLKKQGDKMTLTVFDMDGKEKLSLEL